MGELLRRNLGNRRCYYPAIAEADEHHVFDVLVLDHPQDIVYVRVQPVHAAPQVRALPEAGESRCVHLMATSPQMRDHSPPTPSALPAAMHKHECRHVNLLFAGVGSLSFHPLEPSSPLLRSLERIGVVAGLSEDLPVTQFEDEHEVDFPPPTIVDDPLDHPQPLPYQHAAQPPRRSRSRVGLLELPHLLAAPQTLARLRPLHGVVIVAYPIFRLGTEDRKQLGEQVVGLLLIHLLEVGCSLLVHLRYPFRSREGVYLPTSMLPSCCQQAKPSTPAESLFTGVRGSGILRTSPLRNSPKFENPTVWTIR